ncbi:hypothetical protein Q7Z20_09880, partial [Glaesserella parasuis]|nr:hypothetical protein [Glaesserella parasuis]
CLMAQGAKQLYFLYNPIMKVLVMGFSFAHILIQGANRLGGNSVGGSLVFAKRAIQRILQNLAENRPLTNDIACERSIEQFFQSLANPKGDKMLTASEVLSTVRSQMATYANVYRTEANLVQLLNCLTQLEQRYCPLEYQAYQGIEIYHALKAAQSVVKAMLSRKVSLGAHYIV